MWELSKAYYWDHQAFLAPLKKVLVWMGPGPAMAAPPVPDAGPDQVVTKNEPTKTILSLNGSASWDPENDTITHEWYGPFPNTTGEFPLANVPEGLYTVSLTVHDSISRSTADTATIEVNPCVDIAARAKSGKVQLTWTHIEGTERYDVYHSDESDPSNFIKIGETTSTYSTYLDVTVQNETTYLYVVGRLLAGSWCYSNVIASHPTAVRTRGTINYAPVTYSTPISHGTVGIIYNYDVNAADPNRDVLNFSLLTAPAGMAIDDATGLIDWIPPAVGTYPVTVQAEDGNGLVDTQSFEVVVGEMPTLNQPPVIISTPVTECTEDESYAYDVDAQDPGDVVTYHLDQAPDGMSIDPATGLIEWTPTHNQVGDHPVSVRAEDAAGLYDEQHYLISVAAFIPPNLPPVADAGEDQEHTIIAGETLGVNLDGSGSDDPDGTITTYAWTGIPDPEDVVQPSVTLGQGSHTFSLVVTDNDGETSAADDVTVTVIALHPPVILIDPLVYEIGEGEALNIEVAATDADGDVVTLSAAEQPTNSSFTTTPAVNPTGSFDFAPDFEQAGIYEVAFAATDTSGLGSDVTVQITVTNVNRLPTADNQQVGVHESFPEPILLTGSDPDGDPLSYMVLTDPLHGILSGTAPDLTYTPEQDYRGDDSFDFEVSDGNGGTAIATVSISVFANQPPRITSMPLTVAGVDFEYVYPLVAVDPDGDVITYNLITAPDGMTVDAVGEIHWTPMEDQAADHGVSIQVDDGYGGIDTQTYWIRVSNGTSIIANTPPIAHAGDDYTMEEGVEDVLDGSHSFDADGDHLFYFWSQTGGPEVSLDNRFAPQPHFTAPEVALNTLLTFELVVNDGTVESEVDEVNVMVLNMDLPPEGNGVVTNSNLDGPGSLVAAIRYANAHPDTRITFDIPDTDPLYDAVRGVWQLQNVPMGGTYGGSTGLHLHGDGWILDGYTQTENQGDRNPFGPEIEIIRSDAVGGTMGVSGDNVVIRGIAFTQPGNEKGVLMLCPGKNMIVEGNYIGIDATGTTVQSNGGLVMETHACAEWGWGGGFYRDQFNPPPGWTVRVGGSRPGQGNLLATARFSEIKLGGYVSPETVTIQGNVIGLDRTGTIALGEPTAGGIATGSDSVMTDLTIGGVTPGSRNVIADGIKFYVRDNEVVIQNNYIGTDITGSVDATPDPGAVGTGIEILDRDDEGSEVAGSVLIGGDIPGAGNLIAGFRNGIRIATWRQSNNLSLRIQGNLIGTDATGTSTIGNYYGILVAGDPAGLIGGTHANEGNVFGGNQSRALNVTNLDALIVQGNMIGVGLDGVTPVPNGTGILAGGYGSSIIGGVEEGAGNVIAFNEGPGIDKIRWSPCSTCANRASTVRILGNQIHDNAGMGIDGWYVTRVWDPPEDYIEGLQNYPVITGTEPDNGVTRVTGYLNTSNPPHCLVEIFANRDCDDSGYGEGERWIGAVYPAADGSFETVIPENLSGSYLTATATRMTRVAPDPRINSSGFSPCSLVGDAAITNAPPVVSSNPIATATAETPYSYQVMATDPEGGPLSYALALAPTGMTIDTSGLVDWTPTVDQEGRQTVTIVVRDAEGLYASQNYQIQVLPLVDTEPPVVSVGIPIGLTVDRIYELIGTICDPYLVWYGIELKPEASGEFRFIAEGAECVQGDVVGIVDPTIMANGLYNLRISAYDEDGHLTVLNVSEPLEISSKLKIGRFTLAFQDIAIPVAGIPITVQRIYNSFNKQRGDFGVGWDMALVSGIKVQVTRTLGTGWSAQQSGSYLGSPTYDLVTGNTPRVLLMYADGRQDRFEFTPSFVIQPPIAPDWVRPAFTPLGGTTATLEAVSASDLLLDGGQLLDLTGTEVGPFDPDRYRLTTAEGMELVISITDGLERITDPNGNSLTFGPNAITHSSGLAIGMERDTQGRVTRVTDPMGYEVTYDYDSAGDLVGFTDQEGHQTLFGYDDDHNLVSITDPRGVEVLQTQYDEFGRMIGTVDGLGNAITMVHDTENAVEYITDRNGNTTAYEYDSDGNIISQTDPLGNVTTYTYDDQGNQLSKTDALGNTTTSTYDGRNNKLSETDPLGNTTIWTYNSRNQILTTTDPLGNVTTYTYDSSGNLLTETDALGSTSTHTYDPQGNRLSITDALGHVTTFEYDNRGYNTAEVDALGNRTTYTYNDLGNRLTEIRTRTTASGPVSMMTAYEYNLRGDLTRMTDPLGYSVDTEYNAIGKRSAVIDKKGNRTEYEYDETARLQLTRYPDGTEASRTHDPEGNVLTMINKGGQLTSYEYDERGDLILTTLSDGAMSTVTYDALGRIVAISDSLGRETQTVYDALGREVGSIDPMGNMISFGYDANGNQASVIDANGNSTIFEYDARNRLIRTRLPDGTTKTISYDAVGQKIAETDQKGNMTHYEYDALGRLVGIVDAHGELTAYTYDEVGNRLTQTDANGNMTSFRYDSLGRVVTRTLPMGQEETLAYDADGNLITKFDFNGNTITYTYDVRDRLIRNQYPDTEQVLVTYTSTGKRDSVTDRRGVTTYAYNVRDWLNSVTNPDGSVISYTYDNLGNRISVTAPSGTTHYGYDASDRLVSVTDSDGELTTYTYDSVGNRLSVTYPNGTVATYTYDSLNRLISLRNEDLAGTAISSSIYTLGPTGNRLQVTEQIGRVVAYTYDHLYRLTQEVIYDPVLGDETIGYSYDAVGNRLTKAGASGTTSYFYNANDQLIMETAPGFTITYIYDDNGNTISKSNGTTTTNYVYDYENRLVQTQDGINTTAYDYDADGIRVSLETNGIPTRYLVDKNRPYAQVLEEREGSNNLIVSYVYGDDLISQDRGGEDFFYHYDGQRSTRALTDTSGVVTDRYVYDAFGNMISKVGSTENTYLFSREQYDENIENYYLRARYYDQKTGRFRSMDVFPGSSFDPSSLHKYVYTKNDPVNMIDPSGHFSLVNLMGTLGVNNILNQMRLSHADMLLNAKKDSTLIIKKMIEPGFCIRTLGLLMTADGFDQGFKIFRSGNWLVKEGFQHMGSAIRMRAEGWAQGIVTGAIPSIKTKLRGTAWELSLSLDGFNATNGRYDLNKILNYTVSLLSLADNLDRRGADTSVVLCCDCYLDEVGQAVNSVTSGYGISGTGSGGGSVGGGGTISTGVIGGTIGGGIGGGSGSSSGLSGGDAGPDGCADLMIAAPTFVPSWYTKLVQDVLCHMQHQLVDKR